MFNAVLWCMPSSFIDTNVYLICFYFISKIEFNVLLNSVWCHANPFIQIYFFFFSHQSNNMKMNPISISSNCVVVLSMNIKKTISIWAVTYKLICNNLKLCFNLTFLFYFISNYFFFLFSEQYWMTHEQRNNKISNRII